MTEFSTPVDIGNRALQHCGATRMDPTQGFVENSKNASEIAFAYGKLRRAELRRNVWRFATRRSVLRAIDPTTMLLSPSMWSAGTTYFVGSIVSDQSNNLWISRVPSNLGNDPLNSTTWEAYFGPLTVPLYTAATGYFAGDLVYTTAGDGTNRVYLSLQNSNSDVPATATAWDATTTFMKNQVVSVLSTSYMSLIDLNTNNPPGSSPAAFSLVTTYAAGQQVAGSDGVIYTSIGSGNVGHDPTSDGGFHWTNTGVLAAWTTAFAGGKGSLKWLQIGGADFPFGVGLSEMNFVYPIGSGPSSQSETRNVYRLPSGYLREAPQDPKAGATSALGAPSGLQYNDWLFEGNYIVTRDVDPVVLRFVADVTDVTQMDDMFCEGLAARIALEVCETLTQSTSKLQFIGKEYEKFMNEARTVNAIETGADEPPEDDWVACRL